MSSPTNISGSDNKSSYDNGDRVGDQQQPYYRSKMFNDDPQYPYEESMNDLFAINKANHDARHPEGPAHEFFYESILTNSLKKAFPPASPPTARSQPSTPLYLLDTQVSIH
jgi:hypothetical protein